MGWRDEVEENEFVSFNTGPFTGTFTGGKFVEGKYGKCLQLSFKDTDGNDKKINTKSKRLAGQMKNVPDGAKVKIFRHGEGFETSYQVEVLSTKDNETVSQTSNTITGSTEPWEE